MNIESAWAVPDSLLCRTDLEMTEKVVLAVLIRLGGLEKYVWPRHLWLAKKLGVSERTIRRSLKHLVELGEIAQHKRRWKIAQYTVTGQSVLLSPDKKVGDSPDTLSYHIKLQQPKLKQINSSATKDVAPAVFNFKDEIKKLEDNPRRDLNIIAFYFTERNPRFENYQQFKVALTRHLRAAKSLVPFSDKQLVAAAKKAAQDWPEWTLDTLVKILTK